MTDFSVLTIKILSVALLQPLHEFPQGNPATFEQEVDMIGHQAVGINPDIVPSPVRRQFLQIVLVVGRIHKGLLSLVAAYDNVIENAGGKQSRLSGHGLLVTQRSPLLQDIQA